MPFPLWFRVGLTVLAMSIPAIAADKAMTRAQARNALEQKPAEVRLAGVLRLAEIGTMADTDRLATRLHDDDGQVRLLTEAAMWQIWNRCGDQAIDALYQRGIQRMKEPRMREAVATLSDIIRRMPSFAEAWNKRETIYYLLGDFELSIKDCDEVIRRNRNHFGALSGVRSDLHESGRVRTRQRLFRTGTQGQTQPFRGICQPSAIAAAAAGKATQGDLILPQAG